MRKIVRNHPGGHHPWIFRETHIPEETYAQRICRRNAFLAGMRADSVVLVQRRVSRLPPATVFFIKYQQETAHLTLHVLPI